jgi:hypothetical protein
MMKLFVIINCQKCGKEIKAFHTARYCNECSKQVRYETKMAWQKIHQVPKERPCIFCGNILPLGHKRFCSNNCKIKFHKKNKLESKKRNCVICGTLFFSKSKINIYCSSIKCQKVLKSKDDKKFLEKKKKEALLKLRPCKLCGTLFSNVNYHFRYCSKKCMKKAKMNVAVIKKRERYKRDICFRLVVLVRSRFKRAIKNNSKRKSVLLLIGCSIDKLKQHIEKQFKPGMSWENYGLYTWHIDHIKPCAAFNLIDFEEQKKCFHYSNLQPLWAKDNLRKREKYEIYQNKENQKIEQEA